MMTQHWKIRPWSDEKWSGEKIMRLRDSQMMTAVDPPLTHSSRHSALNSLITREFIPISTMSIVGVDETLKVTSRQE